MKTTLLKIACSLLLLAALLGAGLISCVPEDEPMFGGSPNSKDHISQEETRL